MVWAASCEMENRCATVGLLRSIKCWKVHSDGSQDKVHLSAPLALGTEDDFQPLNFQITLA